MTMSSVTERELKFDVRPDFVLPDLSDELADVERTDHELQQIVSEYFDTADYALLRASMTLRRRTGTSDVGWQLKVPEPPFREEIRAPINGAQVPDDLTRILQGVTRNQPLIPVSTLITHRSVLRLIDSAGRPLAEVDDDLVEAFEAGDSGPATRSDMKSEGGACPGPGCPATSSRQATAPVRRNAGDELVETVQGIAGELAGRTWARAAARRRRVGRVRRRTDRAMPAGDFCHPARESGSGPQDASPPPPAAEHAADVCSNVRCGAGDAAGRRVRWYAGVLGEVRDAQVMYRRLTGMIADLDYLTRLGPVQARVEVHLRWPIAKSWDRGRRRADRRALPGPTRIAVGLGRRRRP